uniref:Sodium/hydrogen exchanger n=1 Tax=Panagrellus redivivus TaxID=6233 RepID=A0A7E4V829_PANRE
MAHQRNTFSCGFVLVASIIVISIHQTVANAASETSDKPKHFQWNFNWSYVEATYIVTCWILLSSVAKIVFNVNKKFGETLPDTACLVGIGLLLGLLLTKCHVNKEFYKLDSTVFFLYLLPPIVFDAGYFMPNRALFENLDSVALFALVGTLFNTAAIGTTLYFCGLAGIFSVQFNLFEILLFAATISATDPVTVIAVFQETNVNEHLFVNVFGEALFNDGAAIVLYSLFLQFGQIGVENMHVSDYLLGGASFFLVAGGGVVVGLVFAFIASFTTRFITPSTTIVGPIFVFLFPYLSYLTAELCSVSSMYAIVICGMFMKEYIKCNISHESIVSVKYVTKMIAQCSETVVFVFLGLSAVTLHHHWDIYFVLITISGCVVFRTIAVTTLSAILNRFRKRPLTAVDQFMLAYGGLRGAIGFGLALSIPAFGAKNMFVTTTMALIFFTAVLQGITIRPLVRYLKLERSDDDDTIIEKVYSCYVDSVLACIEGVVGQKGANTFRQKYENFNLRFLRRILTNNAPGQTFASSVIQSENLIRCCVKIAIKETLEKFSEKGTAPQNTTETVPHPINAGIDAVEMETIFSSILDKKIETVTNQLEQNTYEDIADDCYTGDVVRKEFKSRTQSLPTALDNVSMP